MILFSKTGDDGERSIYDRFRIEMYQTHTEGLYRHGDQYYIYCPKVNDIELKTLNKYLETIRYLGTSIQVVAGVPTQASKVKDRTPEQIIGLTGTFHSQFDLLSQIHLEFKNVLKNYKIQLSNPYVLVFHQDELSEHIKTELQAIVDRISITFHFKFEKANTLDDVNEETFDSTLLGELIVSRFSMKEYSNTVKSLAEEDEEFWLDNRFGLFTNDKLRKEKLTPDEWGNESSKCLIDINNGRKSQNILNLLSIYEKTIFVAPRIQDMESFFNALNITRSDFIKLAERGRVQFIFPNNFKEYEKHFLEELSETNPKSILLTRKLAAITVCDLRRRNPLLFPVTSISERTNWLIGIDEFLTKISSSPLDVKFFKALLGQLHTIWYSYPEAIHSLGSLGTNMFGVSRVLSTFLGLKEMQTLYMDETSRLVEWSGALDANLIPYPFLGKEVEPLFKATSIFYSGMPNADWVPNNFNYANFAIEKLLVVDNDIPPVEFATTFSNADINRFRRQIFDLVRHKKNINELNDSIRLFNSYIKQHDKKSNQEWDITGFILDAVEVPTGLSFISWTIARIHMLMRKFGVHNESLSEFLDSMETDTLPSAVLVSRMRNQLSDARKDNLYN